PPDVVGLAVVDDLVTGPVVVVLVVVVVEEEEEEYCPRLLVEALGGYRVRVSPGSLVEDVLVRPARALVFDGGADGGPEPTGPSAAAAAASFWRVGADGGFRRKNVDIGFGLFFLGAASVLAVVLATLAPERLRVVGRRVASDRGAGSLLGEPGRWAEAVVVGAAEEEEEEEKAAVPVAVGGRSVEEPCVGFRSERVRARDEDMMVGFFFSYFFFFLGVSFLLSRGLPDVASRIRRRVQSTMRPPSRLWALRRQSEKKTQMEGKVRRTVKGE
ncbi:hypothetical protein LY76DRAFT_515626, partial [Colletotrichum caudatum]